MTGWGEREGRKECTYRFGILRVRPRDELEWHQKTWFSMPLREPLKCAGDLAFLVQIAYSRTAYDATAKSHNVLQKLSRVGQLGLTAKLSENYESWSMNFGWL